MMQKISRLPLSTEAHRKLSELSRKVSSAKDPKTEARSLWEKLDKALKSEVKTILAEMSAGLERCMYCEDSQGTDIEHFRPKSTYPAYAFLWENYLLACAHCNSNYKRTKFPEDASGEPLLVDPSVDEPFLHLVLSATTGIYSGADLKGLTTIDVYGLNRDVCVAGRANAWTAIECLIPSYAQAIRSDHPDRANKINKALREYPFQSIRAEMSRIFRNSSDPSLLLSEDVIEAFMKHPELL